jgi:beta-lactamase regulating signal transducer with metallopeptidase domain
MTVPALQPLAQLLTERLLNSAAATAILAALVSLLLRLIGRRQDSGTRFAVWFSALLAIFAFPFLSGTAFGHSYFHAIPAASAHGKIILSASWAFYLFAAWGVGAALLLLRIGVGLWRMYDVRRNCTDVDLAAFDSGLAGVLPTLASNRRVRVCVSSEVAVPAAVGLFRPAIVFPAWLLTQLSSAEIEMILRHELAHFRRWDDWTNLAQKIVKALFFYHPAVWWIENRLALEREMACDDLVLEQTGSPRAYASSLISFAEKLHCARSLTLAQALVSRMNQMSLRVAQILDANRPLRTRFWKPTVAMSSGLLVLVVGVAPYMPRFVAFEKQPSRDQVNIAQTTQWATGAKLERGADVAQATAKPVVLRRDSRLQFRAIPVAFHPPVFHSRAAVAQQMKAKTAPRPLIMRASVQQEPASQPAIYVLQTTEYDVSGPSGPVVWTVCIWRIDGKNPADRQLESAIVVSWI